MFFQPTGGIGGKNRDQFGPPEQFGNTLVSAVTDLQACTISQLSANRG